MLRFFIVITLLVFSFQSFAFLGASVVKASTSWNKPTLQLNNDINCESLVKDAESKFYSDTDWGEAYGVRGHGYSKTGVILDWQILGGYSLKKISAYGKDFFLHNFRHPGCGGACERNQPLVSEKPIPTKAWTELELMAESAPPAMNYGYTYALSNNKAPYMFVLGQYQEYKNKLFVYRLSPKAQWVSACEISLVTKEIPFHKEHSYFKAQQSINDLYKTILSLSQGGGNRCGSMNTIGRWRNEVSHQLSMTSQRPWAIKFKRSYKSENSYGDYSRIIKQLEAWSLTGISEQKAFSDYKTQLKITKNKLSKFYQDANHWTTQESDEMSEYALTSAVARGFGFYLFNTEFSTGELDLRRAIANNESLAVIKNIPFDSQSIDENTSMYASPLAKESILNFSINRPDILKYLLSKGINPNKINDFGKTPLMYAAQHNLLDSAKLLIEYGSSVSASTFKPSDNCFYNLKTFKITALHYAARYASPAFINLLLNHGAATYMKTENHHKYPMIEETPLDWLIRYTSEQSKEVNSNIPRKNIVTLQALLTPPSPKELYQLEKHLIESALKAYQQGKNQNAYEDLTKALSINTKNEKSLSDMSLVALKNQYIGHSAAISNELIKSSKNSNTVANAWFNQGLACEQHHIQRRKNNIGFTIQYNGKYYCSKPYIYYYLNSWETVKNTARKNKILSLFNNKSPESCSVTLEENSQFKFYFSQDKILLLHPKNDLIPLELLFNQVNFSHSLKPKKLLTTNTSLKVTNAYDLDDYLIKEIESPFGYYQLRNNGELSCSENL